MFDYLDRLRTRPEAYRFRVTIMAAGVITAIIFFVWVTTLSVRLFGVEDTAEVVKEEPSPFKTFQEGLGAATAGLWNQFESLREDLGSIEYELTDSPENLPQ